MARIDKFIPWLIDSAGKVVGYVKDNGEEVMSPPGFDTDSNGNIVANVNHRTGELASLLALDGGNGEISVATDAPAVVRHTGVASAAQALYANRLRRAIPFDITNTTVAAAGTLLGISGIPLGGPDVVDASDYVAAPGGGLPTLLTVLTLSLPAHGGTHYTIAVESEMDGIGWLPVGTFKFPVLFSGEARTAAVVLVSTSLLAVGANQRRIRFKMSHDHSASYVVAGNGVLLAFA